ncbi:S46 family peptidase [Geoalkalibacter subterraneus]|nr:S46 family peptidase [Geoalkalibacter subterraneus]
MQIDLSPFHYLLPLLILGLVFGCSARIPETTSPSSTYASDKNRNGAFEQRLHEAEQSLAREIQAAPSETEKYLRRAEILEILQLEKEALQVLGQALNSSPTPSQKQKLIYRMAVLRALKLGDNAAAAQDLEQLTPESLFRLDAEAAVEIARNNPEAALRHLAQAASLAQNHDEQALVLYHQALAFQKMGEEDKAVAALYHAINRAENRVLIKDIERLWEVLDTRSP